MLKKIFTVFVLLSLVLPAFAEEESWILYEKGLYEIDRGELGNALVFLKKAVQKRRDENAEYRAKLEAQKLTDQEKITLYAPPEFPEAEAAQGDVYKLYQPGLAEELYLKAYEHREYFYIKKEEIAVLYDLVDLYKNYFYPPRFEDMKSILDKILMQDYAYYNDLYLNLKDPFLKNFTNAGPSRILTLYRLYDNPACQAHADLAYYFAENKGDYVSAVTHYLFYLVITLSRAADYYMNENIEYKFESLEKFLLDAERDEVLKAYFLDLDLYRHLFYFADIIFRARNSEWPRAAYLDNVAAAGQQRVISRICMTRAIEVCQMVMYSQIAGEYRLRAEKQIQEIEYESYQ